MQTTTHQPHNAGPDDIMKKRGKAPPSRTHPFFCGGGWWMLELKKGNIVE